MILEKNYLEVYIYDKWSDKELPDFEEGATFVPSVCELRDGTTSKPSLLTEADLVGIMDKNGIGTDATIAQHIDMIINREYVIPRMEGSVKYLVPSTFGIGLVKGYNDIEFERSLSKPQLRREVREIAHQQTYELMDLIDRTQHGRGLSRYEVEGGYDRRSGL